MVLCLARLGLIALHALAVADALPSIVTTTPPANGSSFDFIIIGGGTGGLALSARLSAHPNIRVLTIEAGLDNRTDLATESLFEFSAVLGGPLDWNWVTLEGRSMDGYELYVLLVEGL